MEEAQRILSASYSALLEEVLQQFQGGSRGANSDQISDPPAHHVRQNHSRFQGEIYFWWDTLLIYLSAHFSSIPASYFLEATSAHSCSQIERIQGEVFSIYFQQNWHPSTSSSERVILATGTAQRTACLGTFCCSKFLHFSALSRNQIGRISTSPTSAPPHHQNTFSWQQDFSAYWQKSSMYSF
ncbi:hypothetical protein O6H91_Y116400 [Diphasiastrum complanatum]|nr:hypothetical protein O6H91_Y116400 [Diphasiastrum complanatum]